LSSKVNQTKPKTRGLINTITLADLISCSRAVITSYNNNNNNKL